MENKNIVGILAIIFGLLILIFPLLSQFVLSIMTGIGIIILGIYFILAGSHSWSVSKTGGLLYIIIGFLGFIAGILILGNILLFDVLIGLYLYIAGFMLLFAGLAGLFTRTIMMARASAGLMAFLGIITIILGYFALLSPIYVAIILGVSLIIDGIAILMGTYDAAIEEV
jgi:membrane protein HdeD